MEETQRPIRLLLVDDDEGFLQALEALVATQAHGVIEIVGRARNGEEAVELAGTLEPDLITMDIDMPVMDGVQATRRITAAYRTPIVLVTASSSGERVSEGLAAGALVHVAKSSVADSLVATLLATSAAGETGTA